MYRALGDKLEFADEINCNASDKPQINFGTWQLACLSARNRIVLKQPSKVMQIKWAMKVGKNWQNPDRGNFYCCRVCGENKWWKKTMGEIDVVNQHTKSFTVKCAD